MIPASQETQLPVSDVSAAQLDADDALARFRDEFDLPSGIYFCGHSLGPMPRAARDAVRQELDDWARLGVHGHVQARTPWVRYGECLAPLLANLVGASEQEVVAMNGLTVNLHLLLAGFYRPAGQRTKIIMESGAFSSDRHAIEGQLRWHGLDPATHLIELAPRPGDVCLRSEDILEAIARHGQQLALVLWPGVQFRTGQAFDCAAIAAAAHRAGALVGFDHAHAIGNTPLALHQHDGDFAVWCSYKYLNSGPGAVAGAFVHERHHAAAGPLRLGGWWGHEASTRFAMRPGFIAARGAAGWAVSNPPILSSAPLATSLEIFSRAGMAPLRAKSAALTNWLARCLEAEAGELIDIVTPATSADRGAMLTLRPRSSHGDAGSLLASLETRGLHLDSRGEYLRLAPAPLFNSFTECLRAARILRAAMTSDR